MTKPSDSPLEQLRERIMRWRDGGPAIFAVEALGVPDKWDEETKTEIGRAHV